MERVFGFNVSSNDDYLSEYLRSKQVSVNVNAGRDFLGLAGENYKEYYLKNFDEKGGFEALYDYYIKAGAIECPRSVYDYVVHILCEQEENCYMHDISDYYNDSWWLFTDSPAGKLPINVYGGYGQNVIVPSHIEIDQESLQLLAGRKGRVYRLLDDNSVVEIIMKDETKSFILYGRDIVKDESIKEA